MEENNESESRVFECLSVTCTPLRTERQEGEVSGQNSKPSQCPNARSHQSKLILKVLTSCEVAKSHPSIVSFQLSTGRYRCKVYRVRDASDGQRVNQPCQQDSRVKLVDYASSTSSCSSNQFSFDDTLAYSVKPCSKILPKASTRRLFHENGTSDAENLTMLLSRGYLCLSLWVRLSVIVVHTLLITA
ncbi:hypothetical protein FHG87_009998 [Trinorchestia longiramus]|nr:hypothetical protein FHG87_009998 [Trinorchestia longiramus]